MIVLFLILQLLNNIVIHALVRPNFVIILADDQDLLLTNTTQFMPQLANNIINQGATFNNAFVATPICCPSRSELLSGKYYQNIGAPNGTCMHIDDIGSVFSNSSLFPTMYNNGYLTGMFGKLTNNMADYFCVDNPKIDGFTRIQCPCDFNNFFGTKYMDKYANGSVIIRNFNVTKQLYETAMVGNASIS